jgi:hypothetical protein
MKTIVPTTSSNILHNPGCGILYLQRGRNKVRYEDVVSDSWFLRENLTDKIAFSIPWSVIEPEEGHYCWEHPDWEGCINSWIEHGFKVALMVRGMDTLGTFYNEGVPEWVFDAGAKYIDESIQNYRGTFLLNNIPDDVNFSVRYPVYWDDVYLEKVEKFVAAMGQRYNGCPDVEYIGIGHMGRWGEMHIAHHSPMQPWRDAGYSLENYIVAHKRIIDIYRQAFPDTELSQEIGLPCFPEKAGEPELCFWSDIEPILNYLSENHIHIKFNGLGLSYEKGSSRYLDSSVVEIMHRYCLKTKTAFENLVLPEALKEGLDCGISYWHRGGESQGLGIAKVATDIPIKDKKIFSFYKFFPKEYNALSIEAQKNLWRNMAKKCGYRLVLEEFVCPETIIRGHSFLTRMRWSNQGAAPCYEKFMLRLSLFDLSGNMEVWHHCRYPNQPLTPQIWNSWAVVNDELEWLLPTDVPAGKYELRIKLVIPGKNERHISLAIKGKYNDGSYKLANVIVK